ncbi:MAG: alginate export family protein [Methylococcaceae bacterium]|nr:MAG: alginate export family protein [Methylococcaceae bacterium]
MIKPFVKLLITLYWLVTLLLLPERVNAEDYYQKTKAYRVEPESDPPSYVRNLSKTQFAQFRDVEWLDVGLDFRTRYEYRENDLRRRTDATTGVPLTRYRNDPDNLWLLRTRAYLGVKKILDPLRFAVEFEDSRSYNGLYEKTNADVNEFELIQGYGELYFDHLLGHNRPLSLRVGRQALELVDRRLIATNQFRNTTNNFEGFRVRFGKKQNNWDLDSFAFQPIERSKYGFDQPDQATWFYGAVLSLKQWSEHLTIQPYFIGRKQRAEPFTAVLTDRKAALDIYAPGIRAFGILADTGVDFDADLNKQFGRSGSLSTTDPSGQVLRQHDALAYSLELGYSFDHDWKPRASVYYGYGTGDKNPSDNINNRFDAFYGFNQPWSRNDYFSWDNIQAPKARLEFSPNKNLRFDMGYNLYWLDSATDAWNRANLRDRSGQSGQFLGHEFDLRMLHKLNAYVDWSMSYARFTPGDFTKSFDQIVSPTDGPFTNEASNFFYFEVSLNAFGDGKL